jgi:hypothetical protein
MDEVVVGDLDVRVDDDRDSSAGLFELLVELLNLG